MANQANEDDDGYSDMLIKLYSAKTEAERDAIMEAYREKVKLEDKSGMLKVD